MTAAILDEAIANSASLPQRLAAIDAVDHAGPSLAMLIDRAVTAAMRTLRWMATVDDWDAVDERDLDEARVWFETGQHILDKLARALALDDAGTLGALGDAG